MDRPVCTRGKWPGLPTPDRLIVTDPGRSFRQVPVEQRQRAIERRIRWRQRAQALATERVIEIQPPGVQQHTVDAAHPERQIAAPIAVAGIADQVVVDVLQIIVS